MTNNSLHPFKNMFKVGTCLPENFRQLLTCFFWYQYKRCGKTDVECPNAHYDTGRCSWAFSRLKAPLDVDMPMANPSRGRSYTSLAIVLIGTSVQTEAPIFWLLV